MDSEKKPSSPDTENSEPDAERKEAGLEDSVPLSVRNARKKRKALRALEPYYWMSFASVILLAAALAILTYRMGAQSCH